MEVRIIAIVFFQKNYNTSIYLYYRLFTTSKDDAVGGIFHLSRKNTIYSQIYQNNMDEDSYKGADLISSVIGHPNTAFTHTVAFGDESMEYKTCRVRHFFYI